MAERETVFTLASIATPARARAEPRPIYTTLKGWKCSTEGITEYDKLPKLAQEYLEFIQRESGAKIGMISTGPDRIQTMTRPGFEELFA
jgi:adenylosuccinate synthase